MIQRPAHLRLNTRAPLANGLVFAGLAPGGLVGSTLYPDSSLYGNNGTLTNMDPATDWVFDQTLGRFRLDFDGSNDYVDCGAFNIIEGATEMSVALWSLQTTWDTGGFVTKNNANGFLFQPYSDHKLYWAITGTTSRAVSAADVYALNVWKHLAATYDGSYLRIYVNGVQVAETEKSTSVPVDVGSLYWMQNSGGAYTEGLLADGMVYRRCLSVPEIQQLADPSNILLSGLILPPRRKWWPAVTAAPSGSISGSTTLTLAATGTLTGAGSLSGSSALTLTPSGTLTGSGTLSGTSTLALASSGVLVGTGALGGTSAIAFAPSGTLSGSGALAGSSSITLAATGTLINATPIGLAGTAAMVFGASGALSATGALSGSAGVTFAAAGTLSGITEGAISGSTGVVFAASGALSGTGTLAGVAALVFGAAGTISGGAASVGGKTGDGLGWADVDGLTWEEVDGLEWTCIANVSGVIRCRPRISGSLSMRSRISGVVRVRPRMSGSIAHD